MNTEQQTRKHIRHNIRATFRHLLPAIAEVRWKHDDLKDLTLVIEAPAGDGETYRCTASFFNRGKNDRQIPFIWPHYPGYLNEHPYYPPCEQLKRHDDTEMYSVPTSPTVTRILDDFVHHYPHVFWTGNLLAGDADPPPRTKATRGHLRDQLLDVFDS